MKTIFLGCIALLLYTQISKANVSGPASKYRMTVSLESRIENNEVSLVLNDDQIGIYHHFILEKSLDGKLFIEVSRADEMKNGEGSRKITFIDFPFDKSSMSCVFYRIRAVDELGWFDFTNTVTIMKKQDLATKSKKGTEENFVKNLNQF